MKIDIISIFPDMFTGVFAESIISRALEAKIVDIKIHNLREWTSDKHRSVDAPPYGGGAGMLMRVDIIDKAVADLIKRENKPIEKRAVVLLDTKGTSYTQKKAVALSKLDHIILIAGHYEGVDHRVHESIANMVISIGEYVLSGGEVPVMVVVDSIVRLLPGALGNPESLSEESFSDEIALEYPQYTRPAKYKNLSVPKVLLSGNHTEIKKWRRNYSGKPKGSK